MKRLQIIYHGIDAHGAPVPDATIVVRLGSDRVFIRLMRWVFTSKSMLASAQSTLQKRSPEVIDIRIEVTTVPAQ